MGDQLVLSVTHTRLRSLVRTLAVADEKTGLLSRGAYIDCLLSESNRARTHGTPLSLLLIEIDRGSELAAPTWRRVPRVLCRPTGAGALLRRYAKPTLR